MRPAFLRPRLAPRDAPILHRATTLALVLALHALLLLLLLRLAPPSITPEPPTVPTIVELIAEPQIAPAATPAARADRPEAGSPPPPAAAPEPVETTPPVPPAAPPELPTSSIWSKVIPLTRDQMAAADISRFPSRPVEGERTGTGESGAATGRASGDPGLGRGPNGEPLYNADWQRRPTRAELAFYLPRNVPQVGWGMVACQTVAGYRVEDCREIAESPAGSGLAGAVRQAAWQFRVLPPRIGGRPLVGSWVRIRIEYKADEPE